MQVQDDYASLNSMLCDLELIIPYEKPTEAELIGLLEPLMNWEILAYHLPNITEVTIKAMKEEYSDDSSRKNALILRWLRESPNSSWKQVIAALIKVENVLSKKIQQVGKQKAIGDSAQSVPHLIDISGNV